LSRDGLTRTQTLPSASLEPQTPRSFSVLLRRPTRYSSPAPGRAPLALAQPVNRLVLLLQQDGALAALPEALVDWPAAAFQFFCAAAELDEAVDPSLTAFVCAELGVSLELAKHLRLVLPAWHASLNPEEGTLSLLLPSRMLGATQWLGARELRRWRRLQLFQMLAALPATEDVVTLKEPLCADTPGELELEKLRALLTLQGWAIPVDPMGVSLYGALVGSTWSHLDVTSASPGSLRSEALLLAMQACWQPLGVTARAHAAHCVFAAFGEWVQTRDANSLEAARCAEAWLLNSIDSDPLAQAGARRSVFGDGGGFAAWAS
jgi:hypothetical protein